VALSKWATLLLLAATSITLGCAGGTTLNVQNPAAPKSSQIAIAFQPSPPASLFVNGAAPITAVVNNDPTSSGVDWSLQCQNGTNCGSLSTFHTDSGKATTYLPPPTLSSNTQAVTVSAFAAADHTKNIDTSLTVNAFAGFLKAGTYIVETTGVDASGLPYGRVAALVLDGKGGITGGEQTVDFMNPGTSQLASVNDAVTGGTYVLGPDGRGTLTINTADLNIGQQGVETFSLVALSSSQALLTKTDVFGPNIPPSNESSVGTMDLQTPGSQVTNGGYALVVRGVDFNSSPIAFGGVLNIDGPQSISGNGSDFDMLINGFGTVISSVPPSGTVSPPDKFGRFQISLNTNFFGSGQLNTFTAYVVDNSHLRLIETDGSAGLTTGIAIGQGSLTGTYSNFSGTYTFGIFGEDLSGSQSTLAAAGNFTVGGGSLTSGSIDEIQSGLLVQVSDGFTATYTMDPSGRVDTGSSFTFATSGNGTGPEFVMYMTGNGDPVLVLDNDTEPSLNGGFAGGLATGLAYPTTAGVSLTGKYGVSFTQNFNTTEADATGQICANGSSVVCQGSSANTFSGTVDQTVAFSPQGPNTLSATFQGSAVNGRLTGTISDVNFYNNPLSVAFYLIDSSHGFFVETDGGPNGANVGYLSFGYLTGRVPVCSGCQ
jgi:hypothetical protein